MLLIHTEKVTSRLDYAFKHICSRILGVKVQFVSVIEEFISHTGPKLSYGKQPMGNELFFKAQGLLTQQGLDDIEINVQPWGETIGFFPVGEKSAMEYDIFAATFYLLSRYEEYLPHVKDEMGRFPASESLAFKENFLEFPVIDIWALKFKQVLLNQFPSIQFPSRKYEIHHLVEAVQPFAYSQRGFLRNFTGFIRDFGNVRVKHVLSRSRVLLNLRKDPFDTFQWILDSAKKENTKLTVFFLLGEAFHFREDLNTNREKFRLLVKLVNDYTEVGLVFSYHSLRDEERLKNEKKQMEELTHRPLESSMNDKNLVNLPHNYRSLLEVEVKKDMTMVYDNHLGFRASTCTPFLFYDLDYEIKTPLIVHPIAGKTKALEEKKPGEKESEIQKLLHTVKKVNGTFSILLSNRDFTAKDTFWKGYIAEISSL